MPPLLIELPPLLVAGWEGEAEGVGMGSRWRGHEKPKAWAWEAEGVGMRSRLARLFAQLLFNGSTHSIKRNVE